ncbi:hypothetical protein T06_13095 [Trichinella sp. T6]|nr:hypothetical protein T06_13095 [Trichinella sp. T6]
MYKDICKAILTPEYGKCDYKSIGSVWPWSTPGGSQVRRSACPLAVVGFGVFCGGSRLGGGPGYRTQRSPLLSVWVAKGNDGSRVTSNLSMRRAKAFTVLSRPPFPEAESSTALRWPSSIAVPLSANWRASVKVACSRRQSSRWSSLDARLRMKLPINSLSDLSALHPTSSTLLAKSRTG